MKRQKASNYNTSQNVQQNSTNRVNRTMNLYTSRNKHICKQGLVQNFYQTITLNIHTHPHYYHRN
ncbi:unnamed protein product [Tenebrio molitor]|nr:unnamed protein product [Tenebrio molitor]